VKRSYRPTGPDKLTVEALYERAQGCCELCGIPVRGERGREHHVHHRRPRRMGGSQLPDTNQIQNLLLLDADCHETVESERTAAYAGGWLVRQGDDPAYVQVLIRGREWCLLTDDGQYRVVETVTVPEASS
jgi:5-methylcytosine-specific restriction protein A